MKLTNKLNLPQAFVNAIMKDEHRSDGDISVTGLIDSPKIFQLKKRYDGEIVEDVTDRVWSLYGTAVHNILEKGAESDVLTEEYLKVTHLYWDITGIADSFDGESLDDWKNTSVWTFLSRKQEKKWEEQLNVYAWLYRNYGFTVKKLHTIVILRDWSKNKARTGGDYPNCQVQKISFELWPESRVLAYLDERVKLHKNASILPIEKLPLCTDEERWCEADKWALKKGKNKRATKVCESEKEATGLLKIAHKGATHIEHRPGGARRCEEYCSVKNFCNQYKGESKC